MFWSRDTGFDYLAARSGLEVMASTEPLHCRFGATPTMTAALSFAARCAGIVSGCARGLQQFSTALPGTAHSFTTDLGRVFRDDAGPVGHAGQCADKLDRREVCRAVAIRDQKR